VPGILGAANSGVSRLRRLFGARAQTPPTFGGGLTASELGYDIRNPDRTGYGDFSDQSVYPVSLFGSGALRRAFDARAVTPPGSPPNVQTLPLSHPALPISGPTPQRPAGSPPPVTPGVHPPAGIPLGNGLFTDGAGGRTYSSSAAENNQYGYWGAGTYNQGLGSGAGGRPINYAALFKRYVT
jgi:hypothetical protein